MSRLVHQVFLLRNELATTGDRIESTVLVPAVPVPVAGAAGSEICATQRERVAVGVVTLQGRLERQSEIDIAGHLVRSLPGVVDLQNRLRPEWNDTTQPRQTEIFG